MKEMTHGLAFVLKREHISLNFAENVGLARKNKKGIYILTAKGNYLKQNASSNPNDMKDTRRELRKKEKTGIFTYFKKWMKKEKEATQ